MARTFLVGPLYIPPGQYGFYQFSQVEEEEFRLLLTIHRKALDPGSTTPPVFDSVNFDGFEQDHLREVFGYCPPQNPTSCRPLFAGDIIYCVRVVATRQRGGMLEDIWEYGKLSYAGFDKP